MGINRIEPWTLINTLHRDLDHLAGRRYGIPAQTDNTVADWVPAVDIVEEKERFVIKADVPGVATDAIEINMENGVLSLLGERQQDSEQEVDGIQRFERATGKFFRRFNLPESADAEAITAKSAHGILEISIPKQARIQARRISVEAA